MLTRGFIKLLERYKNNTLPGYAREVMDIWFYSIDKDPVEKNQKEEIKQRIWSGITQEKENQESIQPSGIPLRGRSYRIWRVAAAFILAGTAFYFSKTASTDSTPSFYALKDKNTPWIEVVNSQAIKKELILQDGSKITLEPGSKLWHPEHFEVNSRTVYLEGSGFFDITKDAKRPFLVYSGAVLTRVLGTSFSIKTIAKTGGTEVAVVTGKVIVEKADPSKQPNYDAESKNRVVLTPNKKITFFQSSDHYITGLVENPVIVSNQEEFLKPGAFDFDETPLIEVIEKLERAYGVEITLSNDSALDCPVTADLSSDTLLGKIEIIGAVLNARYEITGSSILLSGGKCGAAKFKP